MEKTKLLSAVALTTVILLSSCSQSGKKTEGSDEMSETNGSSVSLEGFSVDTEASKIAWAGTSLGVYTHTGTVDFKDANIEVSNGKITGGNFTADLSTMVATDENFNPEQGATKEKLIGHLSSPDFFNVEDYPTANFTINGVDGNTATGTLTIRGNSHEETVTDIEVSKQEGKTKITGKLVFDRKKYEVKWDYPVKDKVLQKEIELEIHLVGS